MVRVRGRPPEDGDGQDPAARPSQSRGRNASVEPLNGLDIDGAHLETRARAAIGGRPTIVFLHEGLGSVSQWRDFPDLVHERTGCGILVYSRRGYGSSTRQGEPRDPGYMHREAEVVLPALLDALEIERPVLFGHSDGASIALIFGGTFPGRARGLIVEAPHLFVEDLSIASIAAAKLAYETTDLRAKLARHHADVDGAFRGWNDVWLDPRFRSWNIEDIVAKTTEPVLSIQGADDPYGTIEHLRSIESRVRDVTTVLLANCGHAPHRDKREAVLDVTTAFIARL